jgi:hypothetical protein
MKTEIKFPMCPSILAEIAKQNGIDASQSFPTEVNHLLGDGVSTCLFHRQHEWSSKFYATLMPLCTICGGRCDPRQSLHALCEARQKRGLPTPQLDSFPACGCSMCASKAKALLIPLIGREAAPADNGAMNLPDPVI